jgi:hypothetical protein
MSKPASIARITSAELDKVLQNRPNLKPGDKIKGRVIKVRNDGKVVMDFGKFQAAVGLKTKVKQGDVIPLEVLERGKQLKLKWEQPESKTPKEPKNIIKQTNVQPGKPVEQLPSKIRQPAQKEIKAPPRFSENIQALYENVKAALRILQANLKVSGNYLEIPGEIRQVILNLQSNLNMSEITDNLLNYLSRLQALLQDAGLSYENILTTLNEMLTRLSELRGSQQPGELQAFIQNQLKSFLQSLGDLLADPKWMQQLENSQNLFQITQTLYSLETYVENILSRGLETSLQLSQLMEFSEKLANLPRDIKSALTQSASAKVSESIAYLTKNIEALLVGMPERFPGPGSSVEGANGAVLTDKLRTLLSGLRSHFEPLDIGQSALKLVPKLKSLIENSGMFFEKKISDIINKLSEASARMRSIQTLDQLPEIKTIIENDLKPNLLKLRDFLNNERLASQLGDPKTLESIRNAVEDLLSNISSQQSRAVEQQTQQNPLQMFSFHIPIKGEENPAELKVFYKKGRKKDSSEEFRLSLFLEMDKIGEIRSDFFQLKEDLAITFYVKDDGIKEYIDHHVHEVEEALEPVFKNLNLNVIVSRKKIAQFEAEEETEIISDKTVNVKV